jgi:hypothetical protein
MSETEIMRDVLVAVTVIPGAMFWRNNTGVGATRGGSVIRFGLPGSPDIIGVHRGRSVGIEVKTPTGRLSKQQCRFQQAFEAAGGIYIVARSVSEAITVLEKL